MEKALLNTYEDKSEADEAASLLNGPIRVASERDDTTTIYNLFAEPTWGNLYKLKMYSLPELKVLLSNRSNWTSNQETRHREIIENLERVSKKYTTTLPAHWL